MSHYDPNKWTYYRAVRQLPRMSPIEGPYIGTPPKGDWLGPLLLAVTIAFVVVIL